MEVRITIDWKIFEKPSYLNDIPIEVEERNPEYFSEGESGTKITIKELRKNWTRGMVRDVYRSWNALRSPFRTPDSFDIELDTDNKGWVKGIMALEKIHEYALFHFACTIRNSAIEKFEYEFKPYPLMRKLKKRRITHDDYNVKKNARHAG